MPRIIISLGVALALVFGTLFIKHESSAGNNQKAMLIATQINALNAGAIAQYAQELQASGDSSTTNSAYPTVTNANTSSAPLNATQQLSQNLFTQYVSLKQSGVDVTSDGIAQQLASNLLSQTYVTGTSTTYTEKNLIINANPSRQDFINYGNALGSALSVPLPADGQQEVQIFETFAETNDASVLAGLTTNINRYAQIEKALSRISVPEILVENHLIMMNAFSLIMHDIGVVQTFASDPVGGESALLDYPNEVDTLANAFGAEKIIFLQNNISFSPNDSGYILTK